MTRYLILTWHGGGNVPTAVGLAQELVSRGHQVAFGGDEEQRLRFADLGYDFSPIAPKKPTPDSGFLGTLRSTFANPEHLSTIPELVRAARVDMVIVDCMLFGALCALEAMGTPTVVLAHFPPGTFATPGSEEESYLRGPINRVRAAAGLGPVDSIWAAWSKFATICTTIPALDPLYGAVPANFHYCGPVFEQAEESKWLSPWMKDDRRPLILASFSTVGKSQASRIERALEALAEGPFRIVVTSTSPDLKSMHLAENCLFAPELRHADIMRHVDVTLTHAGHGTIVASLRHDVPIVALPNPISDQVKLAEQIEAQGAGLVLLDDQASPEGIRSAVKKVLEDRRYRMAARQLGKIIAATPGAANAAVYLSKLVETHGAWA